MCYRSAGRTWQFFHKMQQNAIFVNLKVRDKQNQHGSYFQNLSDFIGILKKKIIEILKITEISFDFYKFSI